MKNFKSIIGVSFMALVILLLLVDNWTEFSNNWKYIFPVLFISFINIILGLFFYYKNNKSKANTYILSSLLVLIIGGSSCVSIKFKEKKPQLKSNGQLKKPSQP